MKNIDMDKLNKLAGDIAAISGRLPETGIGMFIRIHAAMIVLTALETINTNQNEDPSPKLFSALSSTKEVANSINNIIPEMIYSSNETPSVLMKKNILLIFLKTHRRHIHMTHTNTQ